MTKRKIARTTTTTKRAESKPVERADDHLTAEDRAVLAKEHELSGWEPAVPRELIAVLRKAGRDNDGVVRGLRMEARRLEAVAERLAPEPEKARDMLADALEIIDLAEGIFYNDGEGQHPAAVLRESIRSARSDIDLLRAAVERDNSSPDWQAFQRVDSRLALALYIAEFRETHGYHKPLGAEQTTGGAS